MGAIWGSIVLLAGSFWAAQACCAKQATDADAKKNEVAKPSGDTAEKTSKIGAGKPNKDDDFLRYYPTPYQHTFKGLAKDFLGDQEQIWTSPARLRFSDTMWLVPAGGFAAGLFVTDSEFSRHLSNSPSTISHYKTLSDAGVGALIGGAGGMWLLGHMRHNEHWSETGFLAGAAALNSLVAVEAMKYTLGRERPYQGNGDGAFFRGGTSFPSEHAAAAWAVAGVLAHEYPGPLPKIMAYGLATLVDLSRIKARQHFPSDVFIGTTIGSLVGQNIFSRHHDPELGGSDWHAIGEIVRGDRKSRPGLLGSPYVPLDSWVYPALDRLIALGYIHSAILDMRPWTRSECARLLNEAGERIDEEEAGGGEAERIYRLLETEFRDEVEGGSGAGDFRARVESVYAGVTGISGEPLTDGFHFGQTIINNYGRPYQEGINSIDGFSGWTTFDRWVGYVRAEYQHAPSAAALSEVARQTIATVDGIPIVPPATPVVSVNRLRLLDAYVGLNLDSWQVTFGQQSLWWGPGLGGTMMLTDNAEPVNMFRINRVSPFKLPSILGFLGPMRAEFFVGQLNGHLFVNGPSGVSGSWLQPLSPQPFIHGQKLAFRPTRNFEFSITRTTIFAGPGIPFTTHTFLRSLFNTGHYTGPAGSSTYPGDRLSGMDFTYRIPKLRNWLTLYGDGYANDQIIFDPTGYPDRAVWLTGIYLARFPGLAKLDFRAEGGYTNLPEGGFYDAGYYYSNEHYKSGYTNNGNVLGSWIGRGGQGEQAWSNYWFTPRTRLQMNFRHQKIGQKFIPGGGSVTDVGARAEYSLRPDLSFSVSVQGERWLIPVIQPGSENNLAASFEIQFQPQRTFRPVLHHGFENSTGDQN